MAQKIACNICPKQFMIFVITVELWFRTVVNPHQLGKYITKQTNNITKGKQA